MPLTPEELAEMAMQLSTEARARLAELLVASLDPADLAGIERKWAIEAKRRHDALVSGAVQGIPADDVFREVRESLKP